MQKTTDFKSKKVDYSLSKALNYAFKLLTYRDRSKREIYDKLTQKGYPESIANETIAYLKDKGFIDDVKLAESLKRHAIDRKHLGKRGVINFLLNRGIPMEIVNSMAYDECEYLEAAKRLAEKKLRIMKNTDKDTAKKRLWGLLSRKGFSADIISKTIKSTILEED